MYIGFYKEWAPDADTPLNFYRLFEKNGIGEKIFADVNSALKKQKCRIQKGIVALKLMCCIR